MMKYKLIFSPAFSNDLHSLFLYIQIVLANSNAAKQLMKQIDTAIMRLKEFPEMYPLCSEPLNELGYRKMIVKNYVIIYTVDHENKCVNLYRCFYGKQDYLRFLGR